MDEPEKRGDGHISVSQVKTWLRCPRQWAYRYISGYKDPPSWAMVGGSAMDETLNLHHNRRIAGEEKHPVSYLQDYFRETITKLGAAVEGESELAPTIDDGTRLLPVYMNKYDPHCDPVAVQKEVHLTIRGQDFVGYIDLIRKTPSGNIVSDHKFVGRQPDARVAASSLQLRAYAQAERTRHVEIVSLVRRKRDPDVVVTPHFISEEDMMDFGRSVSYAQNGMARREFAMADPGNTMVCSPTQCGFWKYCRGRKGGPEPIAGEVVPF